MEHIKRFTDISKADAGIAGGKGASLGEMTRAGIPVPPGFVVTSQAFEFFLSQNDLTQDISAILKRVNHKEMESIERASEEIKELVLNAELPDTLRQSIKEEFEQLDSHYVAVRSSATAEDGAEHAWAGQLDSFLNTTSDRLEDNIKRCFASLFTPRAIFYRFEKGLHESHISVAVVVQKMVQSEKSGIAFSVHPVTEDYNQIIIEASWGLGEAIVSGQVTPDSYVVTKDRGEIVDINIAEKTRGLFKSDSGVNEWQDIGEEKASAQCLSSKEIIELSELIGKIENHYGFPCDIEWAYEEEKFYIVQSRPITTLSSIKPIVKDDIFEWGLYLSRPFDLFTSSIWNMWYAGDLIQRLVGISMQKSLFIEYPKNISNHFREIHIIDKMKARIADISFDEPEKAFEILQRGLQLNKEVSNLIERKEKRDIKEALSLLIDLAVHSIIFPMFAAERLNKDNHVHEKLLSLCAELRAESYYPRFLSEILIPSTKLFLKSCGMKEDDYSFLTIHEILERDFRSLGKRKKSADVGKYYVYKYIDGVEEVEYVDTPEIMISKIVGPQSETISGQVVYPGKAVGKVRRLFVSDTNMPFEKGEILVAISTNPDMIPLMERAIAIVTDEGGIMCHAAIVSRELKKPCIIGTKIATKVLKDGDLVEIDAEKGVVKILSANGEDLRKQDKDIKESEYVRMFEFGEIPLLISEVFLRGYENLDVRILFDGKLWSSYISKESFDKATAEGFELYKSKKEIEKFKKAFFEYRERASKRFEEIVSATMIDSIIFSEFIEFWLEMYHYYRRTEFFYVDGVFGSGEQTNEKKELIEDFGKFKFEAREMLNEIWFAGRQWYMRLSKLLSKSFHISEEDLVYLKIEEIIQIFEGVVFDLVKLAERKKAYIISNKNKSIEFVYGAQALEEIRRIKSGEDSTELKGVIANKGCAKGVARLLVFDASKPEMISQINSEVQQGEILCAETTSPEWMPACRKAGALVTAQGGLLSHAAIVSRELKIPCIIGVSNILKVVRDGDVVEVDANLGKITILKKKD